VRIITKFGRIIVHVGEDLEEMSMGAASLFRSTLDSAKGRISLIFPGGATPNCFFNIISKDDRNWSNVNVVLSDERLVHETSPFSNYGMFQKSFLDNIKSTTPSFLPFSLQHNIGTKDLEKLAENEMKTFLTTNDNLITTLGFGDDGHIASLFPGNQENLLENGNCFLVKNPEDDYSRLSLTYRALLFSSNITFLLKGAKKALPLKQSLTEDYNPLRYPAQYIFRKFFGPIHVFCDEEAASLL